MFTHQNHHHHHSFDFSVLITGVVGLVRSGGRRSYGDEQNTKSNTSGGSEGDKWGRGRLGGATGARFLLRQHMSGQVDGELKTGCQTQDLCRRAWKVPLLLSAPRHLAHSLSLFFLPHLI